VRILKIGIFYDERLTNEMTISAGTAVHWEAHKEGLNYMPIISFLFLVAGATS